VTPTGPTPSEFAAEVRSLARPLRTDADLDGLVDRFGGTGLVCIGEASHGTHEYYEWRARLSRRLIEERGFTWIGVEGDWPDCWRINRWVRGEDHQDLDARGLLDGFERWPTWMWANEEVASFLTWLREWNADRPASDRVGFYGLDVYSLWDSLKRIIAWLEVNAPGAVEAAMQAWQCFVPFREDPHEYAWSTRLVPENCESEVVTLLAEVRRRTGVDPGDDEEAFDARQNAEVAADAERYYRIMVRGDRESWNIRDHHMVDTVDRLSRHLGPSAKGLVWEHNTHVGDARATDMALAGMVNVGQLLRERHGTGAVALIGCAGHRGTVVAGGAWGATEEVLPVPVARPGSHEDLLHCALAPRAPGHRRRLPAPPRGGELRPHRDGRPVRRAAVVRGDPGTPSPPPREPSARARARDGADRLLTTARRGSLGRCVRRRCRRRRSSGRRGRPGAGGPPARAPRSRRR
jgi:erythromycin esterase-like protein